MVSREVVIDISSTVVDESKEIVLIEFAPISSNTTLRMTLLECQYISLNWKASHRLPVAMVSVVDSQGRGYCVEAKYSLLEISVPCLFIDFSQSVKGCHQTSLPTPHQYCL